MRHNVWKTFASWNYDKEENWLNDMSSRGLQLVNPGIGRYTFEEGVPGAYQYRIEYLDKWPRNPESAAYIRFMEESGIEHVGSIKNWVYFRKKTSDGPFDLFNDIDSRIRHIKKIFRLMVCLLPILLYCTVYEILLSISAGSVLLYSASVFVSAVFLFILSGTIKLGLRIRTLKKERRIRE